MITLAKNTPIGMIFLDDKAMNRARRNGRSDGRSDMDCSQGEFIVIEKFYETQFGPEKPDYNLRK